MKKNNLLLSNTKTRVFAIFFLAWLFCCSFVLGDNLGSEKNPYPIDSCLKLQEISNDLDGYYVLNNTIDCSETINWNDGKGFASLGFYITPQNTQSFTGGFDGAGYKIKNLYINRPAENYIGLFGISEGEIVNVSIINSTIKGGSLVGGLVGHQKAGNIKNSSFTGKVQGASIIGGLVGHQIDSAIENSYSEANITGSFYLGGLVGHQSNGLIEQSYSTGKVIGGSYVGGLLGDQNIDGSVNNCYSLGNVSGSSFIGGLVGQQYAGEIINSFSYGNVSGSSDVGGLIGSSSSNSVVSNSYWDVNSSHQTQSSKGVGKTSDQMKEKSTFNSWSIIYSSENKNKGYPYLISTKEIKQNNTLPIWAIYSENNTEIISPNISITLYNLKTMSFLASGQTSWWRMDDVTGSKVVDYMGITQGTLIGNVTQVDEGVFGKALLFDGNDSSYVKTTGAYNSETFFISFWSKPNDIITNKFVSDSGYHKRAVMLGYQDGYYNIYTGLGYPTGNSAQTMIPATKGVWQHIVYGTDGQRVFGYKDGELLVNVSGNLSSPYKMNYYHLGYGSGGKGRNYNGSLDEVIIFDRNLTKLEVKSLYNSSVYTLYKNLTELDQSGTYSFYVQDLNAGITTCTDNQCGRSLNENIKESKKDLVVSGNVTADYFFGFIDWSWIKNVPTDLWCSLKGCTIEGELKVEQTIQAQDYLSSDGTVGWTGNCVNTSFKNGLAVGCND